MVDEAVDELSFGDCEGERRTIGTGPSVSEAEILESFVETGDPVTI